MDKMDVGVFGWYCGHDISRLLFRFKTFHRGNDITLAEEPKVDSSETDVPSFDTADFPQPFLML